MKERQITIRAENSQFETARLFLEEGLRDMRVTNQMVKENQLVFEEVFLRIVNQYRDESPEIMISLVKRIGEVRILIGFSGERFDIDFHSLEQYDPGAAILAKYEEKIRLSYGKGRNSIGILARRTYDRMGLLCIVGMLLAVAACVAAKNVFDEDTLTQIYEKGVLPLEQMFGNAVLMIAAPVTFFSLVTNIANSYAIADNRLNLKKMSTKILLSAALAEGLSITYFYVLKGMLEKWGISPGKVLYEVDKSFSDNFVKNIYDIVPSDIFEPFIDISPFPLVLIAVVTAAALCSMNTHFDTIKEFGDSINMLLSKVLSLIMMVIPFASFLAITDLLLHYGYKVLAVAVTVAGIMLFGVLLMIILAGVKVAFFGINPIKFLKTWLPAGIENFKINSSIDAVPYNIRFCSKKFGISIGKLDIKIPILAQVNQTGNSFVIMFSSLAMMNFTQVKLNVVTIILMAVLVVFISIGAPGQDGSVLIGLVIVFSFIGVSFDYVAIIIFIEATIGRFLPILNTLFDITTVVIEDKMEKRQAAGRNEKNE